VQGSTALLPDVSALLSDLAASVSNAVDLAVQVSRLPTGRPVVALTSSSSPSALLLTSRPSVLPSSL
jgi:hypothetical protein